MEIETLAEIEINEIDKIGPKGLSAYEVYVKNGGTLSEIEWLKSLRGEQGPQGKPGAVKMQVVDTLPDVGETDTIYLLKKDTPGEQNLYDEYVYTETTGWEHIGDTSVDLTDYYTKEETDEKLNNKQDILTPGDNITIENNVISASGGEKNFLVITTPTHIILSSSSNTTTNLTDFNKDEVLTYLNTGSYDKPIILKSDLNNDGYQKTFIFNVTNIQVQYNRFQYATDCIYQTTNYPYDRVLLEINPSGTYPNYTNVSAAVYVYYRGNIIKTTDVLLRDNKSSYVPTDEYNPATKKYVDDNKYTLPVASADTLGGIMLGDQYSVDTTGVLESNAYLPVLTLYTNRDTMWIGHRRYSSNENYTEGGVYDTVLAFLNKKKYNWFCVREWLTNYSSSMGGTPYHINYVCMWSKKTDTIYSDGTRDLEFISSYFPRTRTYTPAYSRLVIRYQITDGVIDLKHVDFEAAVDVIPQETLIKTNTTAYTPTSNYNPSTKLYTDKTHYENMTGYDATKTQVLKNVSGTLTWVDEE